MDGHFAKILQVGKLQLPQRFKYGHCHGVAEVQASGLRAHGKPNAAISVLLQKVLGQTFGFFTEEQVSVILKAGFCVAPGGFGGKAPHLLYIVFAEKVL